MCHPCRSFSRSRPSSVRTRCGGDAELTSKGCPQRLQSSPSNTDCTLSWRTGPDRACQGGALPSRGFSGPVRLAVLCGPQLTARSIAPAQGRHVLSSAQRLRSWQALLQLFTRLYPWLLLVKWPIAVGRGALQPATTNTVPGMHGPHVVRTLKHAAAVLH